MAEGGSEPKVKWVPLESNPEVMNKFIDVLGVENMQFTDVYGLDPELLGMVPSPCCSLILLFPVTEKYEEFRILEEEKYKKDPQSIPASTYYMKQTISNACGTVAIIHCIANSMDDQLVLKEGPLRKLILESKGMTPLEKGKKLETCQELSEAHQAAGEEGQSSVPSPGDRVDLHFVAFVHRGGQLIELDGRKSTPITHGLCTKETFLSDCAKVCQEFMLRDPSEQRFTMIALASSTN
ncbi:Ubiquitin carboxyl-terminal hydrolase isozyme L3 [Oopsacas minuta]|uniref:Ubiquitin carboxyl-terminal hydrolase n=1 Tax=Oopsacas minuta TaxID=111878 RepID=A0AAV7K7V0_9METZ|nr:Ubiquitin carboxyl-terminal hydrolase isozyme L3 [Oopsacas minuta]